MHKTRQAIRSGLHGGGAIRQGLLHGLLEELQLHLRRYCWATASAIDGVDPADIHQEQLRAEGAKRHAHKIPRAL